jgi:pimeloyl-ACP methyl ester carboxylesterase
MALGVPLVCIDLPGHGHSDGPSEASSAVERNGADIATAVEALAPDALAVVGMSLGGMTTLGLASLRPDLVRKMVLVDVTPGVNGEKASQIVAFVDGPESFPDFDELLERTKQFNPTRTESSLRRGILHNALQREDGSWVWRYRRFLDKATPIDASPLWDVVSGYAGPLMLVRGMLPQSVVSDEDEAELVRRQPHARIEHVEGAGHSVQGDRPLELAALIRDFAL